MTTTLLAGAGAVFAMMAVTWLLSLQLRDASIVDRIWGMAFVVQSLAYFLVTDAIGFRPALLLTLVTIWGVRLSLHIHLRNRGHPEDYRYQRMREEHGPRKFWWYSFFSVFCLQGLLSLLIGAPLLWTITYGGPASFTIFDGLGCAVWTVGFLFESIGDWQLKRFKQNPANQGKLLTTGLWAYTRHPNYFGDACLWWGYFLIAVSVDYGWATCFGPLLMTFFIRYVSGVSLLEKDLKKAKPGYDDYVRNVPPFFPRLTPWRGKST